MTVQFANNAFSTLAAGINASVTSLAVASGEGARFPALSSGQYFYATLIDSSNNLEIIKCTARSSDTLTIVRNQESSGAKIFSSGDRIELRLTALGLNDIAAEVYSDSEFRVQDNGDATKQLAFECSGITGGQTRVVTAQDSNLTMAGTNIAQTFTAAQRGTVTDIGSQASTVTVNLDTSNNHKVTLTGNAAFASPTGLDSDAIGQSGSIFITQDGTGSRAPTFNAAFDFVGGPAPTLTTTAAAVDRLDYIVVSATRLQCVATLAYS
jgi:hypothetical protein